jgi:enolase-phosphatase E1
MPKAYLLDIEGTTSPVSFVYHVLFPYARQHMAEYIALQANEPSLQADFRLLAEENLRDRASGAPVIDELAPPAEITHTRISYLLWLMDQDRKSTALKSIQGRIWAKGYENGELRSEIFPDVPPALERWHATARVAIYSSGSVEAQKYLFGYTRAGDLTPFIDAWFDTHIGPKIESASYRKIASSLQLEVRDILFVSDSVRELDAARDAGMITQLSLRPGNTPVPDHHEHPAISSFEELQG